MSVSPLLTYINFRRFDIWGIIFTAILSFILSVYPHKHENVALRDTITMFNKNFDIAIY
jgi:hypothetical protein